MATYLHELLLENMLMFHLHHGLLKHHILDYGFSLQKENDFIWKYKINHGGGQSQNSWSLNHLIQLDLDSGLSISRGELLPTVCV